MEIKTQVRLAGSFKVEKKKADGRVELVADWQKNLITDWGMNYLGSNSTTYVTQNLHVGTGTATPAFTDTQLASFLAAKTGASESSGLNTTPGDRYSWDIRRYEFSPGEAVGNITEVGLSPSAAQGQLFSRALIKDSGGNPTAVTILADEILIVTYELRFYIPESDFTGTSGGYTWTARPALVENNIYWNTPGGPFKAYSSSAGWRCYSGGLPASITAGSSGTYATPASYPTDNSYVAGSFEREFTVTYGTSIANTFTINSFACYALNGGGYYIVGVSPGIVKTNTQELIVKHRISWARV